MLHSLQASSRVRPLFLSAFFVHVFALHEPPRTLFAPWFAETLLFGGGGTLLVGLLTLLLDRGPHSTRALRWSIRTIPCLIAWTCIAAVLIWLASKLPSPGDAWASPLLLAAALALPVFICLRPDALAGDRPPRFWLPRWPGIPAIAIAMIAAVFWYAADLMPTGLDDPAIPKIVSWPWTALYSLLALCLGLMLVAYALSAWMRRWRWSQLAEGFHAPKLFAGARVLAALGLQFGWVSLLLFFPLIFITEASVDASAAYLEHAVTPIHGDLPSYLRILIAVSRFTVSYWWFCVGALMMILPYWIQIASMGRAMHLMEASEGPSDDAPIAPVSR